MNCEEVEKMQIIEAYLKEGLSKDRSEAFERHYFECDHCFAELQRRHALALELRVQDPVVESKLYRSGNGMWHSPVVRWGLATAALILLVVVPLNLYNGTGPAEPDSTSLSALSNQALSELGAVRDVPPYLGATIRGGSESAGIEEFRQGMNHYERGEFARAASFLIEATQANPSHLPSKFYLGICLLMDGRPAEAEAQFQNVIGFGESPFEEESRWYLAKAYFQQGSLDRGREQLEAVVEFDGILRGDAEVLLELFGGS